MPPGLSSKHTTYCEALQAKAQWLLRKSIAPHILVQATRHGFSPYAIFMSIKDAVGAQRPLDPWQNSLALLLDGNKQGLPIREYVLLLQKKIRHLSEQGVAMPRPLVLSYLLHITNKPEWGPWRQFTTHNWQQFKALEDYPTPDDLMHEIVLQSSHIAGDPTHQAHAAVQGTQPKTGGGKALQAWWQAWSSLVSLQTLQRQPLERRVLEEVS
ncbi:hypothetical protein DIS24_g8704 [Lasiodiplodia hormozganensis]|uniref:Uncharacterized protein n=1 Tax=Lasiodiplodia hormozganensis TaxID=869390 RepID=A0AA39Y0P7_9PEZI|nr:hypothetical protein DIS24_g8704 [Lasiodiplodia hormozganensis]